MQNTDSMIDDKVKCTDTETNKVDTTIKDERQSDKFEDIVKISQEENTSPDISKTPENLLSQQSVQSTDPPCESPPHNEPKTIKRKAKGTLEINKLHKLSDQEIKLIPKIDINDDSSAHVSRGNSDMEKPILPALVHVDLTATKSENEAKKPKIPSGYVFGSVGKASKNKIGKKTSSSETSIPRKVDVSKLSGFGQNIPLFQTIGESSKFSNIDVDDGEKNDEKIIEMVAKMYTYDSVTRKWKLTGSVDVHLNDCTSPTESYSRIIIRLRETHRLLANTRISSTTICEQPEENEVRLTIFDEKNKSRIICIKAKSVEFLYHEIKLRISRQMTDLPPP